MDKGGEFLTRLVNTDLLPRIQSGGNKGKINWIESIGCKVEFIYDDLKGFIEIIDYDKKKQRVTTKYNNAIFVIKTAHLMIGIKLSQTAISSVCRGDTSHHKSFKFKYIA